MREGEAEAGEPLTAFEILPRVYGSHLTPMTAQWLLTETLAMLLPPGGHRPRAADRR